MANNMIEVHNLCQYFYTGGMFNKKKDPIRAIDDVSINIEEGKVLGLVGESGSGKTTLANAILKLLEPTSGYISINGINIQKASRQEMSELHRNLAVVFQDPMANLNPRFTVEKSIMRPLLVHGVSKAEARSRAEEVMDMVKLDRHYLKAYPRQLSGGQLQRIAVARALVFRPKVMILDEPTSALDVSVQAQVLNILLGLQEEFKITYIMITHDLNVVHYMSDIIAVLYLGKLMEYGPESEVFYSPRHPYTKGLLSAAPVTDPAHRGENPLLFSGEPGSLMHVGMGCRLAPRCPYATDICKSENPQLRAVGDGHFCACHRSDEIRRMSDG